MNHVETNINKSNGIYNILILREYGNGVRKKQETYIWGRRLKNIFRNYI